MEVVHGWDDLVHREAYAVQYPPPDDKGRSDTRFDPGGVVLTIGVFDGVHLGHQSLIRGVVQRAWEMEAGATILTFHPHPRSVVAPDSRWGYLCSLEERIARIAELGPDRLLVLPFTPQLAATSAEMFVEEMLQHLPLRELDVGADFSLGQGGRGDLALLRQLGERWSFTVRSIPPVCLEGCVVSSTRIRRMVQLGDVRAAARCLGRPFSLRGSVVSGAGRGAPLGFPTANLHLHARQILPADGVYAARAQLPAMVGQATPLPALAYVGRRPTFPDRERVVEAHLLDFSGGLLGYELRVELLLKLRPDQAFDSAEALVAQMERDAARARQLLRA